MKESKPRRLTIKSHSQNARAVSLETFISLAEQSFQAGRYDLAGEYCIQIIEIAAGMKNNDSLAQGYYIWCLSALKAKDYAKARSVCAEARRKFGDYLDIVYFEILIEAVEGRLTEMVRLGDKYMELFEKGADGSKAYMVKSCHKVGEVLLMCGQALEQLHEPEKAVEIYEKYISFYPDDKLIEQRLIELTNSVAE